MASVRKSVIVPHACETMFDLVDRVEDYPAFLPWCPCTRVLERSDRVTRARIDVGYQGLATHFVTHNAKVRAARMDLAFVEGPFDEFAGSWRFTPLGEAGCSVALALDYAFASRALEMALGPVFGQILETLVDRFVARAEELGGR